MDRDTNQDISGVIPKVRKNGKSGKLIAREIMHVGRKKRRKEGEERKEEGRVKGKERKRELRAGFPRITSEQTFPALFS